MSSDFETIAKLRVANIELTKRLNQSDNYELEELRSIKTNLLKHLDEYFKAYDEAWADVVEQANKQGITSIPLTEPAAKLINQRQLLRFCYEEIKNEI